MSIGKPLGTGFLALLGDLNYDNLLKEIAWNNKEDVLEGKDARNIEEIFTKVGITNKQIICSKKCS